MAAELRPLIDKVWRHCESTGNQGRTVTLKVKFFDFEIITRSRLCPDDRVEPGRFGEFGDIPAAGRDTFPEVGSPARRVAVLAANAVERRCRTTARSAYLALPFDVTYSLAAEMTPKASPAARAAARPIRLQDRA
ncbi:hypothetical protein MTX25_34235 [Bradyrhizobium sp. ISRA432]|uniref:DinB/UmuC family translesion DNA polymerase n=1 Tax=Bradyrhizobium sp. ISRA442 TaxID=2866197 RepID=UPI0027AA4749|nr:hypothetical protein MTX24_34555 [Bradyrhizobium sp. ISRA426]WGR82773.1 hypothetical protein MTX21_19655 [Bradyrhizobium sp. ISRA430]WGR90470.1 hypothetical protein MTX25_34235 [Bradyrhizobium sp. ISRA432]